MSALSSLLVRDQVVSVRKIEEAIQRQVISGGDLDTVLLDMGAVPENVMSAYRAALYGLLPATRDEVMSASREATRFIPRDVAEKHQMVPLSAEGRTVVVAVARPLGPEEDQQLGFLLGVELLQRVATEVRIAAGLAHHYDLEMPARFRRVTEKLRQRDPGVVPYVKPPEDNRLEAGRVSQLPGKDDAFAEELGARGTRPFTPPPPPSADASSPGAEGAPSDAAPPTSPGSIPSSAPPPAQGVGVQRVLGIGRQPGSERPPGSRPPAPRDGSWQAPRRHPSRPATPLLRKVRGPLSTRKVTELLEHAKDRDTILEIFFYFARQFFDYTALFIVHEDIAEGRAADGPGADADAIRHLAVPLDVPGSFGVVRKNAAPALARLDSSELDQIVARDLGREGSQPALLVPVAIRNRVVIILYGDRSGDDFGLDDVPELLAVVPRVVEAFQRLILRRKFRGYASGDRTGEGRVSGARMGAMDAGSATAGEWKPAEREEAEGVAHPPAGEPSAATHATSSQPGSQPAPTASEGAPSAGSSPPRAASLRPAKRTIMGLPTAAPTSSSQPSAPPTSEPAPASRQARRNTPTPPERPSVPPKRSAEGDARKDSRPELEALGVPRSAPPPPMQDSAGQQSPPSDPAAMPPPVEVDRAEPGVGTYSMRRSAEEVVAVGGSNRAPPASQGRPTGEPPGVVRGDDEAGTDRHDSDRKRTIPEKRHARARQRRGDRRRDTPDAVPRPDVVKLGDAVPAAPPAAEQEQEQEPSRSAPAPSAPGEEEPSVIVDMGDNVDDIVRELQLCGPDEETPVVNAALAAGEAALPALVQHFPGPLWFDRRQPHRRLPRGRDVSAIARGIVAFGERAVPYISSLLGGGDDDVRFYATLLASELPHASLVASLGRRIFDSDPGVRALVLDVLRLYQQFESEYDEVLQGVRAEARVPRKDPERRIVAIRALGELRDVKSLTLLTELLKERDRQVVEAAHRSLVVLARQDFGPSHRRWTSWIERHKDQHRIEWLIDALVHSDEEIRAAAGEELKQLTQEYHGFHPGMPKREREVCRKKYREWWEDEGRQRFASG